MNPLWRARVLAHAQADARRFEREVPVDPEAEPAPARIRPTLAVLRRTLASGSVEDLRALWLLCDALDGQLAPPTDAAELVRMLAWRPVADALDGSR